MRAQSKAKGVALSVCGREAKVGGKVENGVGENSKIGKLKLHTTWIGVFGGIVALLDALCCVS